MHIPYSDVYRHLRDCNEAQYYLYDRIEEYLQSQVIDVVAVWRVEICY